MYASVYRKYAKYIRQIDFEPDNVEGILRELNEIMLPLRRDGISLIFNIDDYNIDPARPVYATTMPNCCIHPCHKHNYYELNYLFKGEGIQLVDGKVYRMNAGDLMIFPLSAEHSAYTFENSYGINILCRAEYIENLELRLRSRDDKNILTRVVRGHRFIEYSFADGQRGITEGILHKIIDDAINLNEPRKPFSALYSEALFLEFLVTLLDMVRTEDGTIYATDPHNSRGKEQVLDYIRVNYTTASLEDVARHFNLSTVMIYSIVKAQTGNSFSTYVSALRLQRAQYLLENTDLSVADVAESVGLKSTEYFCRFFKRQTGYTPLEYRRNSKKSTYRSPRDLRMTEMLR